MTIWDLVFTPLLPKPGHYTGQEASGSLPPASPGPFPPAGPLWSLEGDPAWYLFPVLTQASSHSSAGKQDSTISVSSVTGLQPGEAGDTPYFGERASAGRNLVHPDPLGPS